MAYACPLVLQGLDSLGDVLAALDGESFELLDDSLFLDEVFALFLVLVAKDGFLLIEEFVACGVEALPEGIRGLVGGGAYLFPLFLQLDELVGGSCPLGALLEGLGFLHKGKLACRIVCISLFLLLEEVSLLSKEVVAGGTEALKNLGVHLLGGAADSLPLFLECYDLLGKAVPLGVAVDVFHLDGLYLLADGCLLGEVFFFFLLEALEILGVTLVDSGGGSLEAVPQLFSHFARHGTYLAELLVELLQSVRSAYYVGLVNELLGGLAEAGLGLKVFLEVVVAQGGVGLEQVVELVLCKLELLPYFIGCALGYGFDFLPLSLQLAESVICFVGLLGRGADGFDFFYDGALALEVGFLLLLVVFYLLGAEFLEYGELGLELFLQGILLWGELLGIASVGYEVGLSLSSLFALQTIECLLELLLGCA